jgi:hypothetical protein
MVAPLPFPAAEQIRADGLATHAGIDVAGEPILIWQATPTGFIKHGPLNAMVGPFRADQLVPGGPIEVGDLRVLLFWPTFAALGIGRRLERADRVEVRGRQMAVVQFDDFTHAAAGAIFAAMIQARG